MPITLYSCAGGDLILPSRASLLATRLDGGNLVVNPPRPVWERSALTPPELAKWAALVAAAGRAMLETLPQLDGGCINYWEAGNWALNDEAEPKGPKRAPEHRRMHLHLLGRSRTTVNPHWAWGESPRFPAYAERHTWAAAFERFTPAECTAIVERLDLLLRGVYGFGAGDVRPWAACPVCAYPMAAP
jgi:hypothetical protein